MSTYYIIGTDLDTQDEYVRAEMFYTAAEAVELCERLNKDSRNTKTVYRVHLAKVGRGRIRAVTPFETYGDPKPGAVIPCPVFHCGLAANHSGEHVCGKADCAVYPAQGARYGVSEEQGTQDFTVNELFGNPESITIAAQTPVFNCLECGVLVADYRKHTAWHNKLLP